MSNETADQTKPARAAEQPEFWRKRLLLKGRIRVSDLIQGGCSRTIANSLVATGEFDIRELPIKMKANLCSKMTAFYLVLTKTGKYPTKENDDD